MPVSLPASLWHRNRHVLDFGIRLELRNSGLHGRVRRSQRLSEIPVATAACGNHAVLAQSQSALGLHAWMRQELLGPRAE